MLVTITVWLGKQLIGIVLGIAFHGSIIYLGQNPDTIKLALIHSILDSVVLTGQALREQQKRFVMEL